MRLYEEWAALSYKDKTYIAHIMQRNVRSGNAIHQQRAPRPATYKDVGKAVAVAARQLTPDAPLNALSAFSTATSSLARVKRAEIALAILTRRIKSKAPGITLPTGITLGTDNAQCTPLDALYKLTIGVCNNFLAEWLDRLSYDVRNNIYNNLKTTTLAIALRPGESDPTKVGYFKNLGDLLRNKTMVSTMAKFLQKHAGLDEAEALRLHRLYQGFINASDAELTLTHFNLATTSPSMIEDLYGTPMRARMSSYTSCMYGDPYPRAYAHPANTNWQLTVLHRADLPATPENILARTFTNAHEETWLRLYAHPDGYGRLDQAKLCEVFENVLNQHNFTQDNDCLVGLTLAYKREGFAPYLDHVPYVATNCDGDLVVTDDESEASGECNNTDGTVSGLSRTPCGDCGDSIDMDDDDYGHDYHSDEIICQRCLDRHYLAVEGRHGDTVYIRENCSQDYVSTEDGHYYLNRDVAERNGYWQVTAGRCEGEWHPDDEVFYCDHCNETFHTDEYNEHNDWSLCNDCLEEVQAEEAEDEDAPAKPTTAHRLEHGMFVTVDGLLRQVLNTDPATNHVTLAHPTSNYTETYPNTDGILPLTEIDPEERTILLNRYDLGNDWPSQNTLYVFGDGFTELHAQTNADLCNLSPMDFALRVGHLDGPINPHMTYQVRAKLPLRRLIAVAEGFHSLATQTACNDFPYMFCRLATASEQQHYQALMDQYSATAQATQVAAVA